MPYDKYETVIGLEIHVQLSTKSKAFCGDDTSFGGSPNTQVSTISLGHPGTLPRINKQQVAYAVRLGLALGSRINLRNTFDRKNYFYADLPKGYQITQDKAPICIGGTVPIRLDSGETKKIRIHHIHMEEDAGKLMHDSNAPVSLIDLNRAGVPLLEIVTEPDLRSAGEVDALMSGMRQLIRYLGISDGNMEQGSMRCDCNVSVRLRGASQLGQRCEIKNLNSMRYARRAIAYETRRQIDILETGGSISQQTLNFDPSSGTTSPLRDKEDAHDYRYFPEPDLPPLVLSESWIQHLQSEMPALPWDLFERFQTQYGLPAYDAELLTAEHTTALFFMDLCRHTQAYKAAANLIINKVLPFANENACTLDAFPIGLPALAEFIQLIEQGQVAAATAYQQLFPAMAEEPDKKPMHLAEALQLIQNSDADELEKWVSAVLEANPEEVSRYQKGKKGLLGFFMGEVMKQSKGKADPKLTTALLKRALDA